MQDYKCEYRDYHGNLYNYFLCKLQYEDENTYKKPEEAKLCICPYQRRCTCTSGRATGGQINTEESVNCEYKKLADKEH